MLFFTKNKHIAKYIILFFVVTLAGAVLNTNDTHASSFLAWFTWGTNTSADGNDILSSDSKSMQMTARLYVQETENSGFTVSVHAKMTPLRLLMRKNSLTMKLNLSPKT